MQDILNVKKKVIIISSTLFLVLIILVSVASFLTSKNIAQNKTNIVLDMSNVGFIDSKGLSILLWVRDYCIQNRWELRLAGLDENCMRILEITRLDSEFDLYGELAEAVKSFA